MCQVAAVKTQNEGYKATHNLVIGSLVTFVRCYIVIEFVTLHSANIISACQ